MKQRIMLICLLVLTCNSLFSSELTTEYLIIGKDTFDMENQPLLELDNNLQIKFTKQLERSANFKGHSTIGLYRGYKGYWMIEDNRLYFLGMEGYSDSRRILSTTFGKKFQGGRVFADWFTQSIIIPINNNTPTDIYTHDLYDKVEILNFEYGRLTKRDQVDKYTAIMNYKVHLDLRQLKDTIESRILKIPRPDKPFEYRVIINSKGNIHDVWVADYIADYKKVMVDFQWTLSHLHFDIVDRSGNTFDSDIVLYFTNHK